MEDGVVSIHGTALGFIFVGLSYQNLYFEPEYGKEQKVLGCNEEAQALKCIKCNTVTIKREEEFESKSREIIV